MPSFVTEHPRQQERQQCIHVNGESFGGEVFSGPGEPDFRRNVASNADLVWEVHIILVMCACGRPLNTMTNRVGKTVWGGCELLQDLFARSVRVREH
eukprot:1494169-Amphidinium_carterae.1